MDNISFFEMANERKQALIQEWGPLLTNKSLGLAVESKDLGWAAVTFHNNINELNAQMGKGWFKPDPTAQVKPGDLAQSLYGESAKPESERTLVGESQGHAVEYNTTGITGDGIDTVGQIGKWTGLLLRRIFPQLISKEFFGVQPLMSSHGIIAALKGEYKGNGTQRVGVGRGVILALDADVDGEANWAPDNTGALSAYNAATIGHVTQATSGATGIVRYREGNLIHVEPEVGSADFVTGENCSVASGANPHNTLNVWDAEAGYNRVFKNYGYADAYLANWSAAAGQSDNMPNMSQADVEIQELGLSITKQSVKAQQRILKTSRPNAMAEDFKNNLNADVNTELLNILEYELKAQMNKEFVDYLNSLALPLAQYDVDADGDGRYSKEKLLNLWAKIRFHALQINITSRAGFANRLLLSPAVHVGLELLSDLWTETVTGDFNRGDTFCGTIGGMRAHVHTFATEEYITIGLRGNSQVQAGAYYCPYIPLDFAKAVHPDHLFDEVMGFRTRYAYTPNPFGAENYFRRIPIVGLDALGIG